MTRTDLENIISSTLYKYFSPDEIKGNKRVMEDISEEIANQILSKLEWERECFFDKLDFMDLGGITWD